MAEDTTCRGKFYQRQDEFNRSMKELEAKRELFVSELDKRVESFSQKIQKLAKTGDLYAAGLANENREVNDESDQENVPAKKGRARKKKPLAESSKDNLQEVKIKKEKISSGTRTSASSTLSGITEMPLDEIKTEQTDMPAPSWIPPKKKAKEIKTERASVRSTRTKGKKASGRDSDVVVQNPPITTINLSDTDDSEGDKAQQSKENRTRSTRTKTRRAKAEGDSGTETDTDSTRSTRTKTRNRKEEENIESNEMEPPRTTRTKTLRKGKKVEEESQKDQAEEPPQEIRSTRTRTIKKGAKLKEDTDENMDNKKEETSIESTKTTVTATDKNTEKNREETSDKSNDVPEKSLLKEVPKPTNQGKAKRQRSDSNSGEEEKNKKISKSSSPVQKIEENPNATTRTVYEDARSTVGVSQDKTQTHLNSTYVTDVPPACSSNHNAPVPPLNTDSASSYNAADSTMVLDKPQFTLFDKNSMEGMFTDDDSIEIRKTPPKKATTSKTSKEVFSPYEKNTIKKKVEAFEKLYNGSEIPVKSVAHLRSNNTPSAVREKAKMFTPLGSRFVPNSSSTSKISRFMGTQCNSTSNESLSCMKVRSESAQKESRDRQRRQLEREQALKKKEAMLLAQAEAKKKLNEEKQLKAQQQRKVLEAEKLKQLEAQKQKEAKLKQREREREEYQQKQKLELEKKRKEQKKKLAEMQAQRQQLLDEQAKHPPIYMTTKPPRLPTEDCYDSDDPNFTKTIPPRWCQDEYSKRKQLSMLAAGEKIKNTLFCRHAQTPDLVEIFLVIDPRKLKRSSSVLWRKPPRYTMMPDLNDTKFEEDEELYESD